MMIASETLAMLESPESRAERRAFHDRIVLGERRYAIARMADPYADLRRSLWAFDVELFGDPLRVLEREMLGRRGRG